MRFLLICCSFFAIFYFLVAGFRVDFVLFLLFRLAFALFHVKHLFFAVFLVLYRDKALSYAAYRLYWARSYSCRQTNVRFGTELYVWMWLLYAWRLIGFCYVDNYIVSRETLKTKMSKNDFVDNLAFWT